MKRLFILILFYWILLIENGTNLIGVILELGDGLEVRLSLIIKILFFVVSAFSVFVLRKKMWGVNPLILFMVFLIFSTFYSSIINSKHFISAFVFDFHIQLVLIIVIYIQLSDIKLSDIEKFVQWLRVFGFINALLVIISYLFPSLLSSFQSGTSDLVITRAFGIMGDEVSLLLTFFFFDALVFRKRLLVLFYSVSIVLTGGIGAFITLISLLLYYLFYIQQNTRKNVLKKINLSIISFVLILFLFDYLEEISLIKRIYSNFDDSGNGTGSLRLFSLSIALDMIKSSPMLGTGFGAYSFVVNDVFQYDTFEVSMNIVRSSFNPYVQMICEAGFIGLLVFI